jgi:hypothetical protein
MAAVVAVLTAVPAVPGKLQLLDVAAVLAVPFLLGSVVRDRRLRLVALCCLLWAAGQVTADLVTGLGPRPSMQLATAVTVLALAPVLVRLSRGDPERLRWLVAGLGAGLVAEGLLVQGLPVAAPDSWKYGLDIPAAIAALALADLAWRRGRRWPALLVLVAIAAGSVVSDHRLLSGLAVLTALLSLLPRRAGAAPRVTTTLLVAVGALVAVGWLAGQVAAAGWLGGRSADQVERYAGDPLAILVNVRPEPLQELYLFSARPLTGWGSLPRLDTTTYDASLAFVRDRGATRGDLRERWLELEVPGVAAHAALPDSLVRAGVAALPFWVLLVALALRAAGWALRTRGSPFLLYWSLLVLWSAFFEPMTGLLHLLLGGFLALVVVGVPATRRQAAR